MKNTITSKQACTIAHQIRRETGCSLAEAFKAAYAGNNTVNTKTHYTAEELNQIFSDKTDKAGHPVVLDIRFKSNNK